MNKGPRSQRALSHSVGFGGLFVDGCHGLLHGGHAFVHFAGLHGHAGVADGGHDFGSVFLLDGFGFGFEFRHAGVVACHSHILCVGGGRKGHNGGACDKNGADHRDFLTLSLFLLFARLFNQLDVLKFRHFEKNDFRRKRLE